jgi:hypothetical protein
MALRLQLKQAISDLTRIAYLILTIPILAKRICVRLSLV